MMRIKLNTKIEVVTVLGDTLIGTYKGIDFKGILLKNATVTYKDIDGTSELNMVGAHVDFNKIKDIFELRQQN